jgi:hypothetical protein
MHSNDIKYSLKYSIVKLLYLLVLQSFVNTVRYFFNNLNFVLEVIHTLRY